MFGGGYALVDRFMIADATAGRSQRVARPFSFYGPVISWLMEGKAVSGMAPVSKTGGAVTRMGIVPSAFRCRVGVGDGEAGEGRPLVANQMAPPGVGFDSLAIRLCGPSSRSVLPRGAMGSAHGFDP